jgi:uncharacterized membrane protein YkvA (DUF1232 family)
MQPDYENPNNGEDFVLRLFRSIRDFIARPVNTVIASRVLRSILFFPLDLAMLLVLPFKDGRVSIWAKLEMILGLLYVAFPYDLIPDLLPGIGILDDILVFLFVLNRLLNTAGKSDPTLLKIYWLGDPDALAVTRGFFILFEKWISRFVLVRTFIKIIARILGR